MITRTASRSCYRKRNIVPVMAIGVMCLGLNGCAEIELSAEVFKNIPRASDNPPAPPILQTSARQDSIEPSMRPDPEAFHATGLALWDGSRTLQGVWIAHPMAAIARRVRLTNNETGAQVDAAMFRRDPNLSGPQIIVSSDAAKLLGLAPGHGTEITIEGLAYRSKTESMTDAGSTAEQPDPAATEMTAEVTAIEPVEAEVIPIVATDPALPGGLEPVTVDAVPIEVDVDDGTVLEPDLSNAGSIIAGLTYDVEAEDAQTAEAEALPGTLFPPPRPKVRPVEPVPDVSGDILDGRYFVQAGVFSEPGNAARLVEILRAADLLANELPVMLGDRQFTRVLVGPYYTIAEREQALKSVRRIGPADAALARG